MSMSEQHVTQAPFTRCIRCQSGCIHLIGKPTYCGFSRDKGYFHLHALAEVPD